MFIDMLANPTVPQNLKEEIIEKFEYTARAYTVAIKCVDEDDPAYKRAHKALKHIADDLLLGED
jgi:hypothetical protein